MDEGCSNLCRRKFCVAAGAGLLAMSLPGCDPGAGRLGEGVIDDGAGGGTGTGGNGQTSHDMAQQQQPPHDLAGQPPHDLAGQPAGSDMAQAPSCTPGTVAAGTASSYTVGGTPQYFKSGTKELYVLRDAGGLYALTALCTHSGCKNDVKSNQFYCPCHGATFDFNGDKPTLPAVTPLKHYALCVDAAGNVTVDPSKTVPSNTRA